MSDKVFEKEHHREEGQQANVAKRRRRQRLLRFVRISHHGKKGLEADSVFNQNVMLNLKLGTKQTFCSCRSGRRLVQ